MLSYATLAVIYTPLVIGQPMKLPCWRYWVYALVDTSANLITLTSFNYTSITSVMMADCVSIPVTVALSAVFLAALYTKKHFISVIVCLGGLSMVLVSDSKREAASDGGDVK